MHRISSGFCQTNRTNRNVKFSMCKVIINGISSFQDKMHSGCMEEDREYVHDPLYEDGYHYDREGRICTLDGRVAFT